jgi:hypothetical protein
LVRYPKLLRLGDRRGFRRSVYLCVLLALLAFAPSASGLPSALEVDHTITGTLGTNNWYVSNVTVRWIVSGETWHGCTTRTLTVDTPVAGEKITCSARNDDTGEEETKSVTIKLDKTAPGVSVALERGADANGWYNRPLTVAFAGTDPTSGIAICTSARYAGPDSTTALVTGSCSDKAGNVAPSSVSFKYDATAPSVFAVTVKPRDRSAQLAWRTSTDTQVVEVLRSPGRAGRGETVVYRGSQTGFRDAGLVVGRKYEYSVAGIDAAANRAEQKVTIVATGPLLRPAPAERVTGPPILSWAPVKRASYYNVQLIRNGRRVLSAWPERPSFRLRRTWLYKGRRYRLRPGMYRWYVWPGFGRISAANYARRPLGSSTFVVRS